MKKLLSIALLAVVTTGYSQTNTPPIIDGPLGTAIDFVRNGSNWIVAPYAIYDTGTKRGGGGIAAMVKVNEFMLTGLRLDYLSDDNSIWMPSLTAQFQYPIPLGQVSLHPFVTTGVATPLGGRRDDNRQVAGIMGIGLGLSFTKNLGVFGEVEKWTGFGGNQYRGGLYYKF